MVLGIFWGGAFQVSSFSSSLLFLHPPIFFSSPPSSTSSTLLHPLRSSSNHFFIGITTTDFLFLTLVFFLQLYTQRKSTWKKKKKRWFVVVFHTKGGKGENFSPFSQMASGCVATYCQRWGKKSKFYYCRKYGRERVAGVLFPPKLIKSENTHKKDGKALLGLSFCADEQWRGGASSHYKAKKKLFFFVFLLPFLLSFWVDGKLTSVDAFNQARQRERGTKLGWINKKSAFFSSRWPFFTVQGRTHTVFSRLFLKWTSRGKEG